MTMLTYESVWLEADQLLKVKEFLDRCGVTNYTVQNVAEEGVSTITVPEISEENWNKVEDFEYTLLRGDWEEEKDPQTLQQLQNNLANGLFGQTKKEAQNKCVCISCNSAIYVKYAQKAEGPGHIYSVAGENEYTITGLCEHCFDKAFDDTVAPGEREIEELESFTTNHQ
jgi:hypothetical protein